MKLSISEARKRLPELFRQVRKDSGAKVEITVHDEVVAELRAILPKPEPGAAAKKLIQLMRRLPKAPGAKNEGIRACQGTSLWFQREEPLMALPGLPVL
jgi:antitoxin (DNA-binding transcriptional repressor) of toxin-antitoxin stability system